MTRGELQSPSGPSNEEWAIIMIDAQLNIYRFVTYLGSGVEGAVQLLQRLDYPNELVVRKRGHKSLLYTRGIRRNRECKIAEAVQTLLLQHSPAQQAQFRFSKLVSEATLEDQTTVKRRKLEGRPDNGRVFYRESLWQFANAGTLGEFFQLLPAWGLYPHALVLSLIRQVLESLEWLNEQGIHHLDAHQENIFLTFEENQLVPIVGDFGFARFAPPIESPFNPYTHHSNSAGSDTTLGRERLALSSPPPERLVSPNDRLPADSLKFLLTVRNSLEFAFPRPESAHNILYATLDRLIATGFKERENDKLPPAQRPDRLPVDIDSISRAEEAYLDLEGGIEEAQRALGKLYVSSDALGLSPLSFDTEEDAAEEGVEQISGHGPYEVVNISDPASVRAGVARLVAARPQLRVADNEVGELISPSASISQGGVTTPPAVYSSEAVGLELTSIGSSERTPFSFATIVQSQGHRETELFMQGAVGAEQKIIEARNRATRELAARRKTNIFGGGFFGNKVVAVRDIRAEIAEAERGLKKGFFSGISRVFR